MERKQEEAIEWVPLRYTSRVIVKVNRLAICPTCCVRLGGV